MFVQSSRLHRDLGYMVSLSSHSPQHNDYSIYDIGRLYWPPLTLDQYRVFMASEYPEGFLSPRDDWAIGFVTWAMMSPDSVKAYATGSRKLTPDDFHSGAELWVIDMVAPFGGVHKMVREVRSMLSHRYPNNVAHIIRNNRSDRRRFGYFKRKEIDHADGW